METYFKKTPFGNIRIVIEKGILTILDFEKGENEEKEISEEMKNVCNQLDEYFLGKRKSFDIKLSINTTPFRRKVYEELQKIKYGEVASYQEIAIKVGSNKAYRAVGHANNQNPIAIIIPCHRVIGKNKKLVGYAGGIDVKKWLLDLESKNKNS